MTEGVWRPRAYQSVFAKVIVVMLTMAITLLLLVFLFFSIFMGPNLATSLDLVEDYARVVATTSPDLDTAKAIARRLAVDMRYEGPDGGWTTSDRLPAIAAARRTRGGHGMFSVTSYYLASAPNGGTYLFAWDFGRQWRDAHVLLLSVLLVLMVAVVLMAHLLLRRMLRPLRWLDDGVARLSAGQLDVVLPESRTRDEFGALTRAFNLMVHRVREMIRARDRLLLDVSHELRSPLTRMKVALALLPDGDDDTRAHMVADVAEMEAMIAELLELERLRDGRAIEPVRQDLMPLLREVVAGFQAQPPRVVIADAPRELLLAFDREKVRIVLRNVLENAVKYALPDSRPVQIAVTTTDATVVVRMTDDGPGIPESDRPHLFEPFFRVDRSRSKRTGGYGLGLSICQRIMHAHGGTIAVEPAPGRGASFILTWPSGR